MLHNQERKSKVTKLRYYRSFRHVFRSREFLVANDQIVKDKRKANYFNLP